MRRYAPLDRAEPKYEGRGRNRGAVDGAMRSLADWRLTRDDIASHLQAPLYRNAYAWLISTGGSAALGIIYWLLAAHLYDAGTVGVNAALVSAMILLSGIAQLNLMSALVRFIPSAGRKTPRMVAGSYLVATLLALPVSAVTIAIAGRIPSLNFLVGNGQLALIFILATVVWGVFGLQDSVLTGLRATVWVPAENIIYGLLKIILLWLLAPLTPEYGIFASWILPVVLLVLPVNWLIFRRLIPQHVHQRKDQARSFHWRQLSRYIGGNYVGWLFFLASSRLIPVLVVAIAGASSAAYFYMAWTIASSLRLVVVNMATSLTVEAATDDGKVGAQSRRFLLNMLRLFVPIVAVILLAAPLVLRLAGRDYQEQGVAVLRLLALSVLPAVVNVWYVSVARARQQVGRIIAVEALVAILALGSSVLFLNVMGIVGVGLAWLVAEGAVALGLLVVTAREALSQQSTAPASGEVQA